MKFINQSLAIAIAMLLLSAVAYISIASFDYVRILYLSLDPHLARVIAACLLALLIAAWVAVPGARKVAALRARQQLGDEITATYQYFVDYWSALLTGTRPQDSDGTDAGLTLGRLLALYGGAEVIKVHRAMLARFGESGADDLELHELFGKALAAIRNDLGRDMRGISALQLRQLILPDQPRSSTQPSESIAAGSET